MCEIPDQYISLNEALKDRKMRILLILGLFAFAKARVVNQNCDGVIVHNINHNQEILKDNIEGPYQLAIDYDSNMLFFSYSTHDLSSVFKSAYINLKTNEFQIIDGIKGGFANTVDDKAHVVYLGGNDGIYKFDPETKLAYHMDGTNDNIWQLFFKNNLYYTKYPEEHAYMYRNGQSERVPELIDTKAMEFAIDNDENIYFSNSSGFYIYKNDKEYISYLGDYNVNGISADMFGNLFFSTPNGLFYIDGENKKVETLALLDKVYGIAVESDGNIIYSSENSIIRLKPTKTKCVDDRRSAVVY